MYLVIVFPLVTLCHHIPKNLVGWVIGVLVIEEANGQLAQSLDELAVLLRPFLDYINMIGVSKVHGYGIIPNVVIRYQVLYLLVLVLDLPIVEVWSEHLMGVSLVIIHLCDAASGRQFGEMAVAAHKVIEGSHSRLSLNVIETTFSIL